MEPSRSDSRQLWDASNVKHKEDSNDVGDNDDDGDDAEGEDGHNFEVLDDKFDIVAELSEKYKKNWWWESKKFWKFGDVHLIKMKLFYSHTSNEN